MPKLIILRHLRSQWNLENRFTGWVDVPLSRGETGKAKNISKKVFHHKIDVIYSSPLFRNQDTVLRILEYTPKYPIFIHLDKGKMKDWGHFKELNKDYLPVYISDNLNERYYGKLQGLNKNITKKKYGENMVQLWRRGFESRPPGGENLKDTFKRAVPFYKKYIEKDLKKGKNVLVIGSHNALRALIKYIERVSDRGIADIEVPYGGLIKYELNRTLKLKSKKIL
jgi:2,3-bisphosphoglycerate-dependent phosphoglycerate mutase